MAKELLLRILNNAHKEIIRKRDVPWRVIAADHIARLSEMDIDFLRHQLARIENKVHKDPKKAAAQEWHVKLIVAAIRGDANRVRPLRGTGAHVIGKGGLLTSESMAKSISRTAGTLKIDHINGIDRLLAQGKANSNVRDINWNDFSLEDLWEARRRVGEAHEMGIIRLLRVAHFKPETNFEETVEQLAKEGGAKRKPPKKAMPREE